MDIITTAIVTALAKLTEPAVKDAYDGLKALIARKVGPTHEVVKAVDALEKRPDSTGRRETLEEEVTTAKVVEDNDISAAAGALLDSVKKLPGGQQFIQQVVTGHHNILSGTGHIHIQRPKA